MNRHDDCAGPLFATDSEERDRSHAYGRPTRDSVRTKEQVRAWQYQSAPERIFKLLFTPDMRKLAGFSPDLLFQYLCDTTGVDQCSIDVECKRNGQIILAAMHWRQMPGQDPSRQDGWYSY